MIVNGYDVIPGTARIVHEPKSGCDWVTADVRGETEQIFFVPGYRVKHDRLQPTAVENGRICAFLNGETENLWP